MRIPKESLLRLYQIMRESAKLADSMTIQDGQMALTIPSGFVVLDATDIKFNIAVADIKHHSKILKVFITDAKLKNKTYLIDDEVDRTIFTIHKLKYPVKKPILSQKGTIPNMIAQTEKFELGSGVIANELILELQAILKANKDLIVRVDIGFSMSWEIVKFSVFLSDIDTPLELHVSDLDDDGEGVTPDMTFFNVDFMELPTKSELIYNVYSQTNDGLDQDTITVRCKFDDKVFYREFQHLPIEGSIF